ncbi:hypothetical protein [Xanthobacter sp. KR7-225]|uniref:hypothetical protein n=1 Tax=Xanthobacter sp. KR7-225 TaxID=3156613 RepID=UPI0032B31D45
MITAVRLGSSRNARLMLMCRWGPRIDEMRTHRQFPAGAGSALGWKPITSLTTYFGMGRFRAG